MAVPIALVLASLPLLNLTAYHVWGASGPPSWNPEWHLKWANRFGALWLCIIVLAALSIFWLRPKNKGPANNTPEDIAAGRGESSA